MQIGDAYQKYHKQMEFHVASFCGDETTAMDAVSQAFAGAWIRKEMVEAMPDPAQKAWLYATARNAAVDMKRKEKRSSPILEDYDIADDSTIDLADRITVRELFNQLPDELSIPIHMRYWQGMNSTQIGEAMGIPPATVRTRIKTALEIMRKALLKKTNKK